jgi:photosystem II stability/assembly factor-like uncharacterized protein
MNKIFTTSKLILILLIISIPITSHAQKKKKNKQSSASITNISEDIYSSLKYRYIGPDGNRVIAVVGVPGNSNIVYAGAASGGIFKSTDAGHHWQPIFDKQDVSSIGALAIAPTDNNVIWAGTGETFIRSNISIGNGIYKSEDGGKSWKNMGLKKTGRIGRIVIDPRDPNTVYAAALGHSYGPQQERGVYKTSDGGQTWKRILFVDENTGASDIAIDPNNPRILLAGMWQLEMNTYVRTSGGPGSGLYISKDGGDNWKKLSGSGLPKSDVGKIAVGIAASNSEKMYALIETPQYDFSGVLFRSDNGGQSWKLISHDQEYTQRPHYYSRLAISPVDADEVYFMAHGVWKTTDGGKTASRLRGIGGDDHDMWIDPLNADRILVGNDGGIGISSNHGATFHRPDLPTGQMYHVAVDNQIPYNVYGNRQDGPSTKGPSNSRTRGGIPTAMWHAVGGGESGFSLPDYADNNIVWSSSYDGSFTRYNATTGHSREIRIWPDEPMGWGPAELKYRWNWTFPIHISPHNHNKVYAGSQYVHVTTNGGQSWQEISPDLTTNDKSKQLTSGGLTIDNIGVEFGATLFAIAESPLEKGVIWTGSNDGLVHITRNDGQSWENVTANIPDLPTWGTISNIEPSRHNVGTAYISVDFHQMNNRDPFAYRTNDYGKTWKKITSGIPKSELSYVHVIREDPKRQAMLYLGTENAVYFSINDGESWMPLQANLPHAPVHWLTIQENFSDLVIATYGRGFWIMDDISALRQLNNDILAKEIHLFEQRPAYRFQSVTKPGRARSTPADGQNPKYGASINYYLKEKVDSVKITILDVDGKKIDEFGGTKRKGINRVMWDLRYDRATEPKLRTLPLGMKIDGAKVPERLREDNDGWRPLVTWGYGGFEGPLVNPGTYTVKITIGEAEITTSVDVIKDPNTLGTIEDIAQQTELALKIRDDISTIANLVNQLEWIRKQIDDIQQISAETKSSLANDLKSYDSTCVNIEKRLYQLTLTGTFADDLRGPTMLYSKLMNLAGQIQQGDYKPTDQQVAVYELHKKELVVITEAFNAEVKGSLVAVNSKLSNGNLPTIVLPELVKD